MTIAEHGFYPGDAATPEQLFRLAGEYRAAAQVLRTRKVPKGGYATFRLLAVHAMELYLNACLAADGAPAPRIRGLQHDLLKRIGLVRTEKLRLRKGTERHLRTLSSSREYLLSRYQPDCPQTSELTRFDATLNDLARKVAAYIGPSRPAGEITKSADKTKRAGSPNASDPVSSEPIRRISKPASSA